MGVSTTVATLFAVIVLTMGLIMSVMLNLFAMEKIQALVNDAIRIRERTIMESLKIDDVFINTTSGEVFVNVTNTGETPIWADSLSKIDLIMVYKAAGTIKTLWVPYSQEGANPPFWRIRRALVDPVNHLNLNDGGRGAWDPQEVIEIEISAGEVPEEFVYVIMCTPSGRRAIAYASIS